MNMNLDNQVTKFELMKLLISVVNNRIPKLEQRDPMQTIDEYQCEIEEIRLTIDHINSMLRRSFIASIEGKENPSASILLSHKIIDTLHIPEAYNAFFEQIRSTIIDARRVVLYHTLSN